MDSIAQRSGVSKTTLYAHFDSKDALFNQVVVDVVQEHADGNAALFEVPAGASFREALVAVSRGLLAKTMEPEAVALMRLCVVEGTRMPRVSYEALAAARIQLRESLKHFLEDQATAHRIRIDDPQEAADLLLTLTLRDFQLEAMLPWSSLHTPDAYLRHAGHVADVMLRLYGAGT